MLVATLLGSVFPDFDLIWFYLVDDRAFHHHHYWVHIPGFWIICTLAAFAISKAIRKPFPRAVIYFLLGIALHLILDTLAGGILWAWPFSNYMTTFVIIPATQSNWVLSFLLHWTFLAELSIWIVAIVILLRRRHPRK